jgi:hypothetical protein
MPEKEQELPLGGIQRKRFEYLERATIYQEAVRASL